MAHEGDVDGPTGQCNHTFKTCAFCSGLHTILAGLQPKSQGAKDPAAELLSAVSALGICEVEIRLPNAIYQASTGAGPRGRCWIARFGAWSDGEVRFTALAAPGNAAPELPLRVSMAADAQLTLYGLITRDQLVPRGRGVVESGAEPPHPADALTGALSREGFAKCLNQAISSLEPGAGLALHLIDIDDFKAVNDTFGYSVGNAALKRLADAIRGRLRTTDSLARLGGDEFCVLQRHVTGQHQVTGLAAGLGAAISSADYGDHGRVQLTVSMSSCMVSDPDTIAEDVLAQADAALYNVNRGGKNGYRLFGSSLVREVQWDAEIAKAVRGDDFESQIYVVYQPIFDLRTQRPVRAEALVRWTRSGEFGITTERLIALSQKHQMYRTLQDTVLNIVADDMDRLKPLGDTRLPVSINILPNELLDTVWQEGFLAILSRYGLDHGLINLEVTEQMQIEESTEADRGLGGLVGRGIRLSLDDFGSGYATFRRLAELPFEEVKIDKSLTRSILTDGNDRKIVSHVCALARDLGLRTVAEGCENREQVAVLMDVGCDLGQGFGLCRPFGFPSYKALLSGYGSNP